MSAARTFMRGARRLLAAESDVRAALFTVAFVSLFRLVLEHNLQAHALRIEHVVDLLADRLVFYSALFQVFVSALRVCLPGAPPGRGNVVAVGLLFGLVPPVLAAFVPGLASGGYAYLGQWQWSFYDPQRQALSETITLWTTVVACGAFVLAITRSVARALTASVLAYAGLAWVMTVLPSWLLDEPTARGAAEAWRVRVALVVTAFVLAHAAQPGALLRLVQGGLARALPFAAAAGLAALLAHANPSSAALRCAWVACLALAADAGAASESQQEGSAALATWSRAMAVLLLVVLASQLVQLVLLGALLLLARIVRRATPLEPIPALARLVDALTVAIALAIGAAPLAGGT